MDERDLFPSDEASVGGRVIGRGRTAELFAWEEGRVLKLYHRSFPRSHFEHEAAIARAIAGSGVDTPGFFGTLETVGRNGIVYEYVPGPTLSHLILKSPFRAAHRAARMAREHHAIHLRSVSGLPSQRERLKHAMAASRALLGEAVDSIIGETNVRGGGAALCHGDYHPENILVDGNRWVAIDWMNASSGDPAGDAARSYLMMISPFLSDGIPLLARPAALILKQIMAASYLREYCDVSGITREEILDWLPFVAAARLVENLPGEREWLLRIIGGRFPLKERAG